MSQLNTNESYNPNGIQGYEAAIVVSEGPNIMKEIDEEQVSPEDVARELGESERKAKKVLKGLSKLQVYDQQEMYVENGISDEEALRRISEVRESL